jgi:type IV secretion system protein VirB5
MHGFPFWRSVTPVLLVLAFRPAHAQFAVIDAASIAQLTQETQTLAQQLASARAQLLQLQIQYRAMTGTRGMQSLLSDTVRNYMPRTWSQFDALGGGAAAGFPTLSAIYQGQLRSNAVLSSQQLDWLSAQERAQIQANRHSVALLQSMAQDALSNASGRFAMVQKLIDAIPVATDQKAMLELQARIGAEQGMLQSEQTKLQVLFQGAVGQDWALRQRDRELAIAQQGHFASRFEPKPR